MQDFNYSQIREQKWDSDILGYIAAIYKEAGKQEQYLKQRPEELEKLVEIAKVQSTEASNAIEGIVTTSTRMKQLVAEKTTPKNRDEQQIAGYRDVLNIIHENFDAIPISRNYILQLHKIMGRQRMFKIISVQLILMVTQRFCLRRLLHTKQRRHWTESVKNTTESLETLKSNRSLRFRSLSMTFCASTRSMTETAE